VLRLRQVAIAAHQLAPVVDGLQDVLGLVVVYRDPEVARFGLENAVLAAGSQFLEVVAPVRPDAPVVRYLQRRGGDSGYMVILQTDDQDAVRARARQLQVRVAFEAELSGGHRLLQLHPADTGGAFLEVDQVLGPGAERPDGPWPPAGPDWPAVQGEGRVSGILAAEVEAADPERVALRWGQLLGRQVERDAGGRRCLNLDGAVLRFTETEPGRADGLRAVDLALSDGDASAPILLGGLRLNLKKESHGPGADR
jgi:hypothetical protein